MHVWNVCELLPDYTAQHRWRQSSSYWPLWEPEISRAYSCSLSYSIYVPQSFVGHIFLLVSTHRVQLTLISLLLYNNYLILSEFYQIFYLMLNKNLRFTRRWRFGCGLLVGDAMLACMWLPAFLSNRMDFFLYISVLKMAMFLLPRLDHSADFCAKGFLMLMISVAVKQ
jgi:hypothetical protein